MLEQLLLGGKGRRQAFGTGGKKGSLAGPETLPHGWEIRFYTGACWKGGDVQMCTEVRGVMVERREGFPCALFLLSNSITSISDYSSFTFFLYCPTLSLL